MSADENLTKRPDAWASKRVDAGHLRVIRGSEELAISEAGLKALRAVMARRVRLVRDKLGLTRNELADAMGKTASWLRKVEGGETWAPHSLLLVLSNTAMLGVDYFYGPFGVEDQSELSARLYGLARDVEALADHAQALEHENRSALEELERRSRPRGRAREPL